MKPPAPFHDDDVWSRLCEADLVRPDAVAAGRARLAANDWPSAIDVADALLRGRSACQLVLNP